MSNTEKKSLAVIFISAIVFSVLFSCGIIKAIDIVKKNDFSPFSTVEAVEYVDYNNVESETVVTKEIVVPVYTEQIVEVPINPVNMEKIGDFRLTAYCPCSKCCGQWGGSPEGKVTSIEVGAYQGITFAVDPRVIPYGTKLYVEGVGVGIATDCGGGIKGNRIDVYCISHSHALDLGVFGNYAHAVYVIHD